MYFLTVGWYRRLLVVFYNAAAVGETFERMILLQKHAFKCILSSIRLNMNLLVFMYTVRCK